MNQHKDVEGSMLENALKTVENYMKWWKQRPLTEDAKIAIGQHGHTRRRLLSLLREKNGHNKSCAFYMDVRDGFDNPRKCDCKDSQNEKEPT